MNPDDQVGKLQALVAREEIYGVICDYMRGQDRLDYALQRSSFHDDAIVDCGLFAGNPDEYTAFAQTLLKKHLFNHHMIGQADIRVEGSIAYGEIYFQAYHRVMEDGEEQDLIISGRYVDRYEYRQGAWKIATRTEIVDWARTDPAADSFLATNAATLYRGARGSADLSYRRRTPQ